jgi:hypothetical protein
VGSEEEEGGVRGLPSFFFSRCVVCCVGGSSCVCVVHDDPMRNETNSTLLLVGFVGLWLTGLFGMALT